MTSKICSLLLFLTLSLSCGEEVIDWPLTEGNLNTLVVDAIITNDRNHYKVKLSSPIRDINQPPAPIFGAHVTIEVGNITHTLLESSTQPGLYINPTAVINPIGETYFLAIEYLDKSYTASATMLPVNVFNHITFSRVPNTDSLVVNRVPNAFNEYEQAMFEINIDWSHLIDTGKTHAQLFYYTFNTIDVGQIFSPARETVLFPIGSRVIVRKHSLSPEYAAFLRALVAETEWQGGLFEESNDNLPTNISNGGLGFFSACAVLADSLIAQ